jgi:hypothetical protein
MLLLSFLIPIAYIPGITGASIATGWAVLSCGLPVVTWREGAKLSSPVFPLCGLAFILYACWSLDWVDNPVTGLSTLWQYAILAGVFYAGTQLDSLRPVAIGLGIGFGISSLLSVAQVLGLDWIIEYIPCRPSGLMFNPVILGEGCALTILLCLSHRLWWLAAALTPGLVLSQSRAGLLALAVGLVLGWCRPERSTLYSAACPLTFAALVAHDSADDFRWMVWRVLYHFLDFWGHGAGSIEAVLIRFNGQYYAPAYAHNEFLDLAYQYGIGFGPAALILLLPATMVRSNGWPAYMGFLICSLFSFPLHSPPLAFIGLLVAGHVARDWSWAGVLSDLHRYRPASRMDRPGDSNGLVAV